MKYSVIKAIMIVLLLFTLTGCAPLRNYSTIQLPKIKMTDGTIIIENWGINSNKLTVPQHSSLPAQWLEQLIDTIEAENHEEAINVFSQTAIASQPDLDSQIDELFNFWSGELVSFEELLRSPQETWDRGIHIKDEYVAYSIKTTTEQYSIMIKCCTLHTGDSSAVGIYAIHLIRTEDAEPNVIYWGDKNWLPGILIEHERN